MRWNKSYNLLCWWWWWATFRLEPHLLQSSLVTTMPWVPQACDLESNLPHYYFPTSLGNSISRSHTESVWSYFRKQGIKKPSQEFSSSPFFSTNVDVESIVGRTGIWGAEVSWHEFQECWHRLEFFTKFSHIEVSFETMGSKMGVCGLVLIWILRLGSVVPFSVVVYSSFQPMAVMKWEWEFLVLIS
jgi:hypothetical protein